MDGVRAAIQNLLDGYGDGRSAAHRVVAVGLERVTSDGGVESGTWAIAPPDQPDYVTDGLLLAVEEARADITD